MAQKEYEELQKTLTEAPTTEARKRAAEAMRKYLASQEDKRASLQTKRKGSTPTLVVLPGTLSKEFPTAVPLSQIPDEIEKNPEYYKRIQKYFGAKK